MIKRQIYSVALYPPAKFIFSPISGYICTDMKSSHKLYQYNSTFENTPSLLS